MFHGRISMYGLFVYYRIGEGDCSAEEAGARVMYAIQHRTFFLLCKTFLVVKPRASGNMLVRKGTHGPSFGSYRFYRNEI